MHVKLRCAVKRSGDLRQLHRTSTDEPRRKGHSKPDAIPNKSGYVITSQLDCLDIQNRSGIGESAEHRNWNMKKVVVSMYQSHVSVIVFEGCLIL